MLTQILLSILIVTFITFGTLIFLWWKKYGKKIFGLFDKLNGMKSTLNNSIPNIPNIPNIGKNNDIDQLKNSLNMLSSLMGKIPHNNKSFKQPNQK